MDFLCRLSLLALLAFPLCSVALAQPQNETQGAKGDSVEGQVLPKAFSCVAPTASGDIPLRVAIDGKGNVSDVKALSGPKTLIPTAEACAKTWKFENLLSAPVTETLVLRYETKDCPAKESENGELQYSWGLRDDHNLQLAYIEGEQPPPPLYPEEERKAGIAGRMVFSVSLRADGTVKDLKVVNSLSPRLDKEVMDELRPLKFQVLDGVSEMHLQGLLFQITFHSTCTVPKIVNYMQ